MRYSPLVIVLGCASGTDTGNVEETEKTADAQSARISDAATRWRGLRLSDVSFTGFGKLSDGGLRVNAGTFVAELPEDGQLHLKHRSNDSEIIVGLESWGRDNDMRVPFFKAPILGKCIKDAVGMEIKAANKSYKAQGKCLKQAEQQAEGIQAWWRGGMDSFEQGWTITEKPSGSDFLSLTVSFGGVEFKRIQQDLVEMEDDMGNIWTYDGLNAWDTNGEPLEVWFEPGNNDEILIVVNDTSAQYPITVDPWFSTTGNEVVNEISLPTDLPTSASNGMKMTQTGDFEFSLTSESYEGEYSGTCSYGAISGYAGTWDSSQKVWTGMCGSDHSCNNGSSPTYFTNYSSDFNHYKCGEDYYANLIANSITTSATNVANTELASYFGKQVHPLGDTNGDGYEDILVTAPNWTAEDYSNKGRIFIFRGSASGLETSPISSILGQADNDYFGKNVLTHRDINNDGHDDVIVAAPDKDSNGTDSGSLYVYFGSAAGISTSAAGTVTGIEDSAQYGSVMDWAGDVNGDGYEDLIIGNRANDTSGTDMGAAYLYYGTAGGYGSAPSVVWYGSPTTYSSSSYYNYDYFGYDVAGIGDINGDGYDDVAVSAPYHDSNGADAGKVYIYLGSSTGISATADYARYGSDSDYFGMDLKKIGDINGDGYDELYVDGYVWLGSESGISGFYDTQLDVDRWMGDIDDDGYDDVMYNNALCYGASDASLTCDSARSNAQIVADITGDGFYDYISADPTYDSNKGRIYTYLAFEPDVDLDGYLASEDCNDKDATINPSATEICDGIDNDCDELIDDDDSVDSSSGTTFYADSDGDGYGDEDSTTVACTVPTGYVANSDDCDDTTGLAKPGGTELPGDGVDQDCDGGDLCFADYDNDGYRSTGGTTIASSDLDCSDAGEASAATPATDCNDLNASINPGATETPDNGVDEDCNGGETCYVDADDDGYRTIDTSLTIPSNDMDCLDAGEGASAEPAADCDDTSSLLSPGGTEIVGDGLDQNCDGGDVCYADADDDGFRAMGGLTVESDDLDCTDPGEALPSEPATDCDDSDSAINPGVSEIAGDEFDQNCDGTEVCYADEDGDGYRGTVQTTVDSSDLDCTDVGEATAAMPATDCDDTNAGMNPMATETVGDNIDFNCDGSEECYVDSDSDGYRNMNGNTITSSDTDCDDAGEGTAAEPATDCADNDSSRNPGAQEVIVDGIDQDCDGGDACYADADNDGQRDNSNATVLSLDADCNDPGEADGSVPATDCDDSDGSIYSGATEVVDDGVDSNCDGTELCYVDADGDGYRDSSQTTVVSDDLVCDDEGEASASAPTGDCDDADATINSGATEIIGDGIDSDCNGSELCYADVDEDGYVDMSGATVNSSDLDCLDAGEGLNTDPMTDCDDTAASVYPGATETIDNGIDEDCDGGETCYADLDDDGFRDATGATMASLDLDCLDATEGRMTDPATDCDDTSADINPIATEVVGDGIDQNCDSQESCYIDADNDGFRDMNGLTAPSADLDCDDVGEGSIEEPATDCDDSNAYAYPGAEETIADGVDQDCDGGDICYIDADADGFRDESGATMVSTDLDCTDVGEANATSATDCNDLASNVYPGATEVVDNGIDEDCDGGDTCYVDADNDGFRETTGGTVLSSDLDCADIGEGTSSEPATDCNDGDASINPGMLEMPSDGLDSNCDGAESCYEDYDNDGYRAMNGTVIPSIDDDCDDPGEGSQFEPATDCNDNDASVYPMANEVVGDGVDQDCDGGDVCYIDADADGYRGSDGATMASADLDCLDFGEAEESVPATDCDDNSALINVDAEEEIADGIDQNCDGIELCFVDADNDGFRENTGEETVESSDLDCIDSGEATADDLATDCDDEVSSTYPGATEIVGDEIDQDCDGTEICYADMDGDGYRTFETIQSADTDCDDAGEADIDVDIVDCNDQIPSVNPGENEIIDDGIDNDCDGVSEMSDSEPSSTPTEPTPEPSEEVVDGEDVESGKSGCSTVPVQDLGWILLVPLAMCTRRRKRA